MKLDKLIEVMDKDTRVDIFNNNGTGGAYTLALVSWGCTAESVKDTVSLGAYAVERVQVGDGCVQIWVDELPWDYGSYWEGEWGEQPTQEYEVTFTHKVYVREADEAAAKDVAYEKMMLGDAEETWAHVGDSEYQL